MNEAIPTGDSYIIIIGRKMNGVRTMMMVSFIDNSCRRHDIGAAGSGAFSSPAFSAISKPTTPQTTGYDAASSLSRL